MSTRHISVPRPRVRPSSCRCIPVMRQLLQSVPLRHTSFDVEQEECLFLTEKSSPSRCPSRQESISKDKDSYSRALPTTTVIANAREEECSVTNESPSQFAPDVSRGSSLAKTKAGVDSSERIDTPENDSTEQKTTVPGHGHPDNARAGKIEKRSLYDLPYLLPFDCMAFTPLCAQPLCRCIRNARDEGLSSSGSSLSQASPCSSPPLSQCQSSAEVSCFSTPQPSPTCVLSPPHDSATASSPSCSLFSNTPSSPFQSPVTAGPSSPPSPLPVSSVCCSPPINVSKKSSASPPPLCACCGLPDLSDWCLCYYPLNSECVGGRTFSRCSPVQCVSGRRAGEEGEGVQDSDEDEQSDNGALCAFVNDVFAKGQLTARPGVDPVCGKGTKTLIQGWPTHRICHVCRLQGNRNKNESSGNGEGEEQDTPQSQREKKTVERRCRVCGEKSLLSPDPEWEGRVMVTPSWAYAFEHFSSVYACKEPIKNKGGKVETEGGITWRITLLIECLVKPGSFRPRLRSSLGASSLTSARRQVTRARRGGHFQAAAAFARLYFSGSVSTPTALGVGSHAAQSCSARPDKTKPVRGGDEADTEVTVAGEGRELERKEPGNYRGVEGKEGGEGLSARCSTRRGRAEAAVVAAALAAEGSREDAFFQNFLEWECGDPSAIRPLRLLVFTLGSKQTRQASQSGLAKRTKGEGQQRPQRVGDTKKRSRRNSVGWAQPFELWSTDEGGLLFSVAGRASQDKGNGLSEGEASACGATGHTGDQNALDGQGEDKNKSGEADEETMCTTDEIPSRDRGVGREGLNGIGDSVRVRSEDQEQVSEDDCGRTTQQLVPTGSATGMGEKPEARCSAGVPEDKAITGTEATEEDASAPCASSSPESAPVERKGCGLGLAVDVARKVEPTSATSSASSPSGVLVEGSCLLEAGEGQMQAAKEVIPRSEAREHSRVALCAFTRAGSDGDTLRRSDAPKSCEASTRTSVGQSAKAATGQEGLGFFCTPAAVATEGGQSDAGLPTGNPVHGLSSNLPLSPCPTAGGKTQKDQAGRLAGITSDSPRPKSTEASQVHAELVCPSTLGEDSSDTVASQCEPRPSFSPDSSNTFLRGFTREESNGLSLPSSADSRSDSSVSPADVARSDCSSSGTPPQNVPSGDKPGSTVRVKREPVEEQPSPAFKAPASRVVEKKDVKKETLPGRSSEQPTLPPDRLGHSPAREPQIRSSSSSGQGSSRAYERAVNGSGSQPAEDTDPPLSSGVTPSDREAPAAGERQETGFPGYCRHGSSKTLLLLAPSREEPDPDLRKWCQEENVRKHSWVFLVPPSAFVPAAFRSTTAAAASTAVGESQKTSEESAAIPGKVECSCGDCPNAASASLSKEGWGYGCCSSCFSNWRCVVGPTKPPQHQQLRATNCLSSEKAKRWFVGVRKPFDKKNQLQSFLRKFCGDYFPWNGAKNCFLAPLGFAYELTKLAVTYNFHVEDRLLRLVHGQLRLLASAARAVDAFSGGSAFDTVSAAQGRSTLIYGNRQESEFFCWLADELGSLEMELDGSEAWQHRLCGILRKAPVWGFRRVFLAVAHQARAAGAGLPMRNSPSPPALGSICYLSMYPDVEPTPGRSEALLREIAEKEVEQGAAGSTGWGRRAAGSHKLNVTAGTGEGRYFLVDRQDLRAFLRRLSAAMVARKWTDCGLSPATSKDADDLIVVCGEIHVSRTPGIGASGSTRSKQPHTSGARPNILSSTSQGGLREREGGQQRWEHTGQERNSMRPSAVEPGRGERSEGCQEARHTSRLGGGGSRSSMIGRKETFHLDPASRQSLFLVDSDDEEKENIRQKQRNRGVVKSRGRKRRLSHDSLNSPSSSCEDSPRQARSPEAVTETADRGDDVREMLFIAVGKTEDLTKKMEDELDVALKSIRPPRVTWGADGKVSTTGPGTGGLRLVREPRGAAEWAWIAFVVVPDLPTSRKRKDRSEESCSGFQVEQWVNLYSPKLLCGLLGGAVLIERHVLSEVEKCKAWPSDGTPAKVELDKVVAKSEAAVARALSGSSFLTADMRERNAEGGLFRDYRFYIAGDRDTKEHRLCRRLRQRGETKVRDTFGERHTNAVTPKFLYDCILGWSVMCPSKERGHIPSFFKASGRA
ncbi:hypothetical protein CSUI_003496 [Cystoisospora suis]|uniref:Uncharacterized protein n=1 Tax=Cystoisospora suis TaxID=483139 RepID=A0A2C6KQ79_9APIC|nr:hypothetical protein CSUI_003496 [Cystoisospora suis]